MGHAAVEIAHSFDLGGFRRPSELLRDVATTTALSFDHAPFAHFHHSGKMVSYETMVDSARRMKRLDCRETSELDRAVAASVDVSGRAYAHAVAADCAAERNATLKR